MSTANRLYLCIMILAASFLLFYNLGNQYLWQDEAETAALAKNIFKFGLPQASDGKNTVILLELPELSKNYILGKYWMGQPWLAIYIAHISFRLFGITTLAARLPFALIGLFSIILTYFLARRLFKDNAIANITILLATCSVPLLLHFRQCRYYAPGIFLTLASVYAYLEFIERKRFALPFLLTSLFLLINTSISYFLSTASAIILHLVITERKTFFCKRNLLFFVILCLFTVPILQIFSLPRRLGSGASWILHNFKFYLRAVNKYIFPWRSALILYGAIIIKNRNWRIKVSDDEKRSLLILIIFILSAFPYLLFVNFNSLRYVIHVAPLFIMVEAYILARIMSRFKILICCAVLPLAILTNVFSISFPVRTFFINYIYEITHDYDGPAEGIVKFLNANAKPSDTVKIYHRFDNPLIFYTDLKIDNMPPFDNQTFPEWIVFNTYWNRDFETSDYYKEIRKRYEEITLPCPDIPWENRPDDMGYHKFRTDTSAPKVKIYKRRN